MSECVWGEGGGCECRGGGDCVRAMLSSEPSWVSCSVRWGGGGGGVQLNLAWGGGSV